MVLGCTLAHAHGDLSSARFLFPPCVPTALPPPYPRPASQSTAPVASDIRWGQVNLTVLGTSALLPGNRVVPAPASEAQINVSALTWGCGQLSVPGGNWP